MLLVVVLEIAILVALVAVPVRLPVNEVAVRLPVEGLNCNLVLDTFGLWLPEVFDTNTG